MRFSNISKKKKKPSANLATDSWALTIEEMIFPIEFILSTLIWSYNPEESKKFSSFSKSERSNILISTKIWVHRKKVRFVATNKNNNISIMSDGAPNWATTTKEGGGETMSEHNDSD